MPFRTIHDVALMMDREGVGRKSGPNAGIIDNRTVKTAESGGPRGFDAGKKIVGCNRRLAKDFAASIAGAEAWLLVVAIQLFRRRLIYNSSFSARL